MRPHMIGHPFLRKPIETSLFWCTGKIKSQEVAAPLVHECPGWPNVWFQKDMHRDWQKRPALDTSFRDLHTCKLNPMSYSCGTKPCEFACYWMCSQSAAHSYLLRCSAGHLQWCIWVGGWEARKLQVGNTMKQIIIVTGEQNWASMNSPGTSSNVKMNNQSHSLHTQSMNTYIEIQFLLSSRDMCSTDERKWWCDRDKRYVRFGRKDSHEGHTNVHTQHVQLFSVLITDHINLTSPHVETSKWEVSTDEHVRSLRVASLFYDALSGTL